MLAGSGCPHNERYLPKHHAFHFVPIRSIAFHRSISRGVVERMERMPSLASREHNSRKSRSVVIPLSS